MAKTYYVSTSGNDSNAGNQEKPFKTIKKVIEIMDSGDSTLILAGIYSEGVNLSKSNLTIKADGKVTTKAVTVTGDSNTVDGFTITDASADAGITVKGNNNLFENNEIFHTGQDGIWFFGNGNTFRGNYIHDILDPSITVDQHVDCMQTFGWDWDTYNVLFEKNICDHTRTSGSNQSVMLARNTGKEVRDITFKNNIFIMHDEGYSPMNLVRKRNPQQLEISGLQVLNNTFYNTTGKGQAAIHMMDITNGRVINNVSIGYNMLLDLDGGTVTQSNNVQSGNYGMVDYQNLNFHLLASSPLINAGINTGISDDFDGTARPQGTGFDIGAYEYAEGGSSDPTNTPIPSNVPTSTPVPTATPAPVVGDITGPQGAPDFKVDTYDYSKLVSDFGKTGAIVSDINHDNKVNIYDYSLLVSNYK